ncbi:MAG: Hint domain-containing protein [Rhodobacteraceae bacterium]|nr:Hint domain-containing protein [Paracoccaceae bacterium]
MALHNVHFYNIDANSVFSNRTGRSNIYNGPTDALGMAAITDNQSGLNGLMLGDDNSGETATADVDIGGLSSIGSNVDAERSWTVQDNVTGQIFQVVQLDVENGAASGLYTLSEIPLVAGRSYTTLAYDSNPNPSGGDASFSYADYVDDDDIVEGSAGDDTIDVNYTGDPDNDMIDSGTNTELVLDWSAIAPDETDIRGGASQDTGGIQVDVSWNNDGSGTEADIESTDTMYVASGETFDDRSSLFLRGNGSNFDTSTTTIDFAAVSGSGFEDQVRNVSFRVNDVDEGTFVDIVTIRAYDADGNPLDVDITISGNDILVGDTVTGGGGTGDSESSANGSFLVEIAGPLAKIEIDYDNGGNTNQYLWVTNIHFEAVPVDLYDDEVEAGDGNDLVDGGLGDDTLKGQGGDDTLLGNVGDDTLLGGDGDDTLDGGAGHDLLYGEAGDDTLMVGGGDLADGGTGDDTFTLDPGELDGSPITLVGGEGGETLGDTLDFNGQLVKGSIIYSNTYDSAGGLSGTATLTDGTIVTFSEIENIICFARGTRILTASGEVPIEELRKDARVWTLDHGLQPIRWINARKVPAEGRFAPVVFRAGVIGNKRDLKVSPQHRMMLSGSRAALLFGEDEVLAAAKHLTNWDGVYIETGGEVEYFHILFDRHEIIIADGAMSESFHPAEGALDSLAGAARDEIISLFPELDTDTRAYGPAARLSLKKFEARLLAQEPPGLDAA